MKVFHFNGKDMDFHRRRVMGILNLTPDSFYDGGMAMNLQKAVTQAGTMLEEGAYILDLGAVSTRPGALPVSPEEEMERLVPVLKEIRKTFPEVVISVDTYRVVVAKAAVEEGADMINDISGGRFDPQMVPFIASAGIPYIIMHIQGTPADMQKNPAYEDVVGEVSDFLNTRARLLADQGHRQVILDPGFGFGKTVEHNYRLLKNLRKITEHGYPLMAGLSRKSLINKVLGIGPADALHGTLVLNTVALVNGADILRVHDVRPAMEAIRLIDQLDDINESR